MDTPIFINMKKYCIAFAVCAVFFFVSCAGLPRERANLPPVGAEAPLPPENIMGKGLVSREKMAEFLLMNNSSADKNFVGTLCGYYIEEAAAEGEE